MFVPFQADHLNDFTVATEDLPWIPQHEGAWAFKPLSFNLTTGTWMNLVRVDAGGGIRRHLHAGGGVHAFVLEGSWRYLEREWVGSVGSYVWEPPGDVHTLQVLGDSPMVTLFQVSGVIQYLDEDGVVVQQDDVHSRREQYLEYCRKAGIEPLELTV